MNFSLEMQCQLKKAVSMKIAVWEELVDQIAEDLTIEFTSMKLDYCY